MRYTDTHTQEKELIQSSLYIPNETLFFTEGKRHAYSIYRVLPTHNRQRSQAFISDCVGGMAN